ncbi:hypothetical protein ACX6XY_13810 [Streptomyces sp. O3]
MGSLLLALACLLLYVALPNVGNAARAALFDAVPGVFTARQLTCVSHHPGHEVCEWSGAFESDDGTVRRTATTLYGSDREALDKGDETPAVDVGLAGRVYGPGGSVRWIFTPLLLLAGYGLIAWLALRHLMPPRQPTGRAPGRPPRRRAPASPRPRGAPTQHGAFTPEELAAARADLAAADAEYLRSSGASAA